MITGEIKNRIDQIWEVFWTGGITNSMTVLEQMTYLFFMKMIDDAQLKREANANLWGSKIENPVFKEGDWENPETGKLVPYSKLRWNIFKNYDSKSLYDNIRNNVFPFIKYMNSGEASAYTRFMKDATFMVQDPLTLQSIVDGIDGLDMGNRDAMGDVYEYVLGKMAASGNNGQFRTPRHIIKMMVDMMEPTMKDIICDPAMGSAGFVVESVKYINEHFKNELMNNANKQHYKTEMFHGFDTDFTMLRIGAMNLMLHGVETPDIAYQDSLSENNKDTDRYTLCLANPPFSGSVNKGNISKSLSAIASTTKTELLFVALFIRMLQMGGRCASIVPDGVLFGSSNAHVALRKELVENQRLQAVISMPSGVFKPYSGVSTAVLVFTKTNAGGTDKVWFYDMKADGFSLDDKRNPVNENNIPDIVARFHNLAGEESRTRKDQSFLVPVEEIIANDYDLSINKYKEVEREKVVYDPVDVIMKRISDCEEAIQAGFARLQKMLEE